jgi:hypothetical protein
MKDKWRSAVSKAVKEQKFTPLGFLEAAKQNGFRFLGGI